MHLDFDVPLFANVMLAAAILLAGHVPMGRLVLERGIVFVDIAVAQVASLGIIVAHTIFDAEAGSLAAQATAIAAALGCAGLFLWTEKLFPDIQEAIIGSIFAFASAVQVLLFDLDPHGAEHLKEALAGQILWTTPGNLIFLAAATVAAIGLCALVDLQKHRLVFYGAFAVLITASVQIAGVLLVFAALILPGLPFRKLQAARAWPRAIALGIGALAAGAVVSFTTDLPTGAAMVTCLVLASFGTLLAMMRASRH
ncbi:MAG: metal ABC transporter permease [Proteobacteria bacterium]|nr:metal ABC transporter permease [Pseudomonadota bacterium]